MINTNFNLMFKCCIKCNSLQELNKFKKDKRRKDGRSGVCKECNNIYERSRNSNPEVLKRKRKQQLNYYYKNREKHEQYVYDNQEKYRKIKRKYYLLNREDVITRSKLWAEQNPERNRLLKRLISHRRRIRKKKNGGNFKHEDVIEILKEQQNKCYYCKIDLKDYHIDHKIPISRGGSNSRENICCACPPCNLKKHTKTEVEFKNEN